MKLPSLCLFYLFLSAALCRGSVDWPQLQFSVVTSNLVSPVHIAHSGDGSDRLFIVEQRGTIRVLNGTNLEAALFLDIRTNVLTSAERGLLSVAFPPSYATNRHFYVYYTRKPDGAVTLSRFSLLVGQELVDTNSEQVLLTAPHPNSIHNGGQMTFGPDGYLYLGIGDGGYGNASTNPAQRLNLLLGKILRIDPENGNPYAIPPSNPFISNVGARPEIWAYGFRNPWRFSFDRQTGDFYITDVGNIEREEVNFQPANDSGGHNYGWPIYEGNRFNSTNFPSVPTNSLTYPVAVYSKPFMSCIIGGYVYRHTNYSRLHGIYFYADFMDQRLSGMKFDEGQWKTAMLNTFPRMSAFGEDESGNLYVLEHSGGKIHKIIDSFEAWRPTFSVASGTINSNTIIVDCLTPGVRIHFTSNGQDPTESDMSVAPGEAITVSNGATNKIRAFRSDLSPSGVASAVYTLKVATPSFNPGVGPLSPNIPVTISNITTGIVTFYTLDGTTPDTNSIVYGGPFLIDSLTTVKARAYRSGFADSDIRTTTYAVLDMESTVVTTAAGSTNAGFVNGFGTAARFSSPKGICFDQFGNVFVADTGNNAIRKILPSGEVITFAGTGVAGFQDGPATNAQFIGPTGVCADAAGNIYVADTGNECDKIRKIDTNGIVSTIVSLNDLCYGNPHLWQLTVDVNGNIFAGSSSRVIKIFPNGTYVTFAGELYAFCHYGWCSQVGLEINAANTIYVATEYKVWTVDPNGSTNLFAGSEPGFSDGLGSRSSFNGTQDTAIGVSNIFVSDINRIRKINMSGRVSTLAGTGVLGFRNGKGSVAQFKNAAGICVNNEDEVYVADSGNNCIRKISSDEDGDEIPDNLEGGITPYTLGINDNNVDSDSDGMSNSAEFKAGTNPLNAASFLAIESLAILTNNSTRNTWPSVSGKNYLVKHSTNLIAWNTFTNLVAGNGSSISLVDPTAIGLNQRRFYRVFLEE